MAKFSRFDPRNKNRDRNKQRSLNKDVRIRYEDQSRNKNKQLALENVWDDEYEDWDDSHDR